MDDELKGLKIVERMLPGRINMKGLAKLEGMKDVEDREGDLCLGCNEIVPHPFAPCSCPEWKEWWEKQNASSGRV